jgi:hypothetical protein
MYVKKLEQQYFNIVTKQGTKLNVIRYFDLFPNYMKEFGGTGENMYKKVKRPALVPVWYFKG